MPRIGWGGRFVLLGCLLLIVGGIALASQEEAGSIREEPETWSVSVRMDGLSVIVHEVVLDRLACGVARLGTDLTISCVTLGDQTPP